MSISVRGSDVLVAPRIMNLDNFNLVGRASQLNRSRDHEGDQSENTPQPARAGRNY